MLDLNLRPDRRQLRQFAGICLIGLAAFGAVLRWRFGLPAAAATVWILAPIIGLLGLAAPVTIRPVYVALIVGTYPIGWVILHLVLGFTFYVVITGIGLVFRLISRDAMGKCFDRSSATYWLVRRPSTNLHRYFRQF